MTSFSELMRDMARAKNGPFLFEGSDIQPARVHKNTIQESSFEKQPSIDQQGTLSYDCEQGQMSNQASNEVLWDGEDDLQNPKNWTKRAKWTVTLFVSAYDTITLISSSMIAPALPHISRDIVIGSEVETQVIFSVFILACGIGPLIFAPLSEIYGRKYIIQAANVWYIIWTLVCGFTTTKSLMIVGRFFSGFGASVVFGVGNGVLNDCWHAADRGKSLAILNFAPLLGPALGPVIGGVITQHTSWRWIFWSMAIFAGALQLLAFFFFHETYEPVILERKAARLRKLTGNAGLWVRGNDNGTGIAVIRKLRVNLARPFVITFTHPIAQIAIIHGSVGFGILYIMLSSYASLWTERYHQNESASGLHYFSLVIGFTVGSQGCAFAMDRIWRHVSQKRKATPELRAILMPPGAFCWTLGLLLYGWGAQTRAHWIVPDIGVAIFGLGAQLNVSSIAAYMTDTYGQYTASALAGTMCVRCICAFGFPLFAPRMYESLGYGWGNSLLALCCAVVGIIGPWLFWQFGARLREQHRLDDVKRAAQAQ